MKVDSWLGKFAAKLFTKKLKPRPAVLVTICIFFIFWGIAIVVAAWIDGSLELPSSGKGLLIHYGFQMAFLSGPLVLITTLFAISIFLRIARNIDKLITIKASHTVVNDSFKTHIDSLFLRGRWKAMLCLLIIIGIAISFLIFKNLDHPRMYWGNDVFNASAYHWSYYIANSCLFMIWGLIYPIGIFYAIHLTLSTELIVSRLIKHRLLKLNFLHTDKCGGMAQFGTLNVVIMLIYVWPIFTVYALHHTYKYTYLSLVLGAVAVSVALIAQSLYGIYWVSRAIRSEKEAEILILNDKINGALEGKRSSFIAAVAIMEYRDRVLSVSAYPYSKPALKIVNVLRFAPTVLAIMKTIV